MIEIDEEIKNKIDDTAKLIVEKLKNRGSVFMNIQIEEEYSQYDVLFTYNFESVGIHQRGTESQHHQPCADQTHPSDIQGCCLFRDVYRPAA